MKTVETWRYGHLPLTGQQGSLALLSQSATILSMNLPWWAHSPVVVAWR